MLEETLAFTLPKEVKPKGRDALIKQQGGQDFVGSTLLAREEPVAEDDYAIGPRFGGSQDACNAIAREILERDLPFHARHCSRLGRLGLAYVMSIGV